MPPLHRHQLACLSARGWQTLLERPWDDVARDCLRHWSSRGLPVVVTRQPVPRSSADAPIAFGLCAPERWQRRRLAFELPPQGVGWFDEFPLLDAALHDAPQAARRPLAELAARLAQLDMRARVYGSTGWQCLSGLRYVHDLSDLDLWLAVEHVAQADAAAAALHDCRAGRLRIDGELMFPGGDAVAWREWASWRAGRCRSVLVKRLDGVRMHEAPLDRPVGRLADATAWRCAA